MRPQDIIRISQLMEQPIISPVERIVIQQVTSENIIYDGEARNLVTSQGTYYGDLVVYQIKPYFDLTSRNGLLILV